MVEEISFAARESDLVDQSSGVSARVAISALELLTSNLERRALATRDNPVYPRLCDLHMLLPAITGKVEMVYEGEQQGAEVVARRLIGQAVKKVFDARFPEVGKEAGSGGEEDRGPYARIIRWFADGNTVTVSDEQPFADYETEVFRVPGLQEMVSRNGKTRRGAGLRRRDGPGRAPPAPQARPPGSGQPDQLQGDGEVPAPQAPARRRVDGTGGT